MSKIKTAEGYLKDLNPLHFVWDVVDNAEYNQEQLLKFSKQYADYVLKAKLESITDEEMSDNLDRYEMLGAKWLKQKLLKDE